jgi:predicted transcriptional regulator
MTPRILREMKNEDIAGLLGTAVPGDAVTQSTPKFGAIGRITSIDGKAQCHICGRLFGHLGAHIKRRHGMEADAYRECFGLNRNTGLIGQNLAEKRRQKRSQLTPLRGSTTTNHPARGKRRPYRTEAKINRDWIRNPADGRYVG